MKLEPCRLSMLNESPSMLQSGFWGIFKSKFGWKPHGFSWRYEFCEEEALEGLEALEGQVLVLERHLKAGFSFAYLPHGPSAPAFPSAPSFSNAHAFPTQLSPQQYTRLLLCMAGELKKYLSPRSILIRFDLAGGSSAAINSPQSLPEALKAPLMASPFRTQPQHTLMLNLNQPLEAILAAMNKKTRYNIRLAERKEISIQRFDSRQALSHLPQWYSIYEETARRDRIRIHSYQYYQTMFIQAGKTSPKPPLFHLYMASCQGTPLAGIITAFWNGCAAYLYGASSSYRREFMPNHLLQWRAIEDAKDLGAHTYDFSGLPAKADPNDAMYGLWRFKSGFGGNLIHYMGSWDYALNKPLYGAWRILEKARYHLNAGIHLAGIHLKNKGKVGKV